jgi:hypothetical protein
VARMYGSCGADGRTGQAQGRGGGSSALASGGRGAGAGLARARGRDHGGEEGGARGGSHAGEREDRERVGLVGGKTEERGTTGSQRKRTAAGGFLQGVQGSGGALGFPHVGWNGQGRRPAGLGSRLPVGPSWPGWLGLLPLFYFLLKLFFFILLLFVFKPFSK